jgi:plasmid stability protein
MSAELAGQAYVEMSVKGKEDFAKAFAEMQASVRLFGAKLGAMRSPDQSKWQKFFRSAKQEFSDLTRITLKYGTIAGAAIGGTAVAAMTHAVNKASDLQETMNKFNVVFGDQAKEMEAWGTQFAKQMGRSKQQTMEFMANAQGLVIPMGIDPQQAGQMSQTLAQLSFDLASFHNSTDAEAFEALRSALTGEAEPMKRFGVIVNETAVKAELLKKGLDPNTANDAQKAMARYNIILQGTTQAQGDVERSGGSWANRMKALQASFDDLSAGIGMAFMPVAEALLGWLKELVESLGGADGATESTSKALEDMGGAAGIAGNAAGYIVKAWSTVDVAFNMLMGTARQLMRNLMWLFKLMINNPLSRGVFGKETIDNLVAIVDEVDKATAKLQEANKERVDNAWEKLMDPQAGDKAVAGVQNFVQEQQAKFKEQQERLKAAREAAKQEAAKGSQQAAQSGQEMGKALDKSVDQAAGGIADNLKAAREEATKQWNLGQPKVALTNLDQIADLKVGQPAEAGAAKKKEEKAKEVTEAKDELAGKTVEVASPQTLESTSLAAFEKFRENVQTEQKAILEKQLAALSRMQRALENPDLAIGVIE